MIGALARRGVTAVLGDEQERALVDVCKGAVKHAVWDAAVIDGPSEGWLDEVAADLAAALDDPQRVASLIRASLGELSAHAEAAWRTEFRTVLGQHRDLELLGETVDGDRLLTSFSSAFWETLGVAAATPGSPLAPLWEHTVLKRILDRLSVDHPPELTAEQIRDWLQAYLLQVDARARQRPSPQYPAQVDPEALTQRVRVRARPLRVIPKRHEDDGAVCLPKGSSDDAEEPTVVVAWATIRERHPRVVVLGEPSYGKTWLLRSEAHRLSVAGLQTLESHGNHDELHIPLWARLDELAYAIHPHAAGAGPFTGATIEVLRSHCKLSSRFSQWLGERIADGPCTLLLDALDEVTAEADRTALANTLPGWARHAQGSRVIVTSRLAGCTGPPLDEHDVTVLELVPFSPAQIERFITAWFSSAADADHLRAQLRHNPAAQGMARVPLLLTLLCILASDPQEPLPTRRVQPCERVLWYFLARSHRPAAQRSTDVHIEPRLELLAHAANAFALRARWTDLMPLSDLFTVIRAAGAAYEELGVPPREVVLRLSQGDGVLVPAGDPSGGRSVPYLFLHRTFHEHLVARCLASRCPQEWWRTVEAHLWFEPEWEEVIALLGGLLPDPDLLLDRLLQVHDDPLFAALAHAGRVVAELPAELASSPQARTVVRRLVEVLGASYSEDRAVAIQTLNRLVHNGNQAASDGVLGLLGDLDPEIREAGVGALAGTSHRGAVDALLALTHDANWHVCVAAVEALGLTHDADVARLCGERLLALWPPASAEDRELFYWMLARIGPRAYRAVPEAARAQWHARGAEMTRFFYRPR